MRRWHSEPPQYMLDLYNEVADANGLTRLPGPYGATVVRAFSEKGLYSLYFNSLYGYKFSQNFILNTTFTHVARKQPCYMVHKEYFYYFLSPRSRRRLSLFLLPHWPEGGGRAGA